MSTCFFFETYKNLDTLQFVMINKFQEPEHMRIGKVSELYHISVDNLYYYINYGLLVPPRPKGQYLFDQATLKDTWNGFWN